MPDNPITVKELRGILEELPDDALIVMSSDTEGNDHKLMEGFDDTASFDLRAEELVFEGDNETVKPAVILIPRH